MEPESALPKGFKKRNDRLKTTICSDTYDVSPLEGHPNKENKNRNLPQGRTHSKPPKNTKKEPPSKRHNKSLSSAIMHSRVREGTPKTKVKRMLSISHHEGRLKTDHSDTPQPYIFKRMVTELKKKVVYATQDSYRLEAFKVLKMIHQTPQEEFYTAKMGSAPERKYTLIKVREGRGRQYERESKAYAEIGREVGKKEKKVLLRVHHYWREKKCVMVATDHYLSPSWHSDHFYLFLNLFKNSPQLIALLIQQLSVVALILSNTGRAHANLTLASIFFPVSRGELKADGLIKVGGLAGCLSIRNKEEVLKMPLRCQTPPEVLNFILFEEGEPFDRDYLETISELEEGWQVDVWSLGVVVLQLLNGGPLAGEELDCCGVISLQRELLIRYSYLLEKLDHRTHLCLSRMLSFSPGSRPHPLEILSLLEGPN